MDLVDVTHVQRRMLQETRIDRLQRSLGSWVDLTTASLTAWHLRCLRDQIYHESTSDKTVYRDM